MITEETDEHLSEKPPHTFQIETVSDRYLLKKICIKKKSLRYSFIGGMWYTTQAFSFDQPISLPFPFTTYYTIKIPDKTIHGNIYRSLLYVKIPLMVLQFEDECIGISFDSKITIGGQEIIPFIVLDEDEKDYIISFYLFTRYEIKTKNQAWLGRGKTQIISHLLHKKDTFTYKVNIQTAVNWEEIVKDKISSSIPAHPKIDNATSVFNHAKHSLFRSYDHINGTFLQLPWRKTPGFTFVHSSYSLTSYDAVRLHYFTKWAEANKDPIFLKWQSILRELFINPKLYLKPRVGQGIIWYNMTNQTKEGLEGFFYLDCGYAGYPGGQATISYHLLKYLLMKKDQDIESLVHQSLEYILSTQLEDGSWPMALKQTFGISVRREHLDKYISSGGTGECIRALLLGYHHFQDKRYLISAKKALSFLDNKDPICKNGLRDIGLEEPEAFSAISIIDAFLDAYELENEESYKQRAITYGLYCAEWFYLYDIFSMQFSWNFHPISYSITPRLSPYEATRIISTYKRLATITHDKLWNLLADLSFHRVKTWITTNGGLSEGVFPIKGELKRLPMEQTFATVELMRSSLHYFQPKPYHSKTTKHQTIKGILWKAHDDCLTLHDHDEQVFSFNYQKWTVTHIKDAELTDIGITLSVYDPYTSRNRIKTTLKQHIRGPIGKYLLGISDLKYILKGVSGPIPLFDIHLKLLSSIPKKHTSMTIDGNHAHCVCQTRFHRISATLSFSRKNDDLIIHFTPITIEVLGHDLKCHQVLFPLVGSKLCGKKHNELLFKGFNLKGDFPKILETKSLTGVDQTLSTNWTHGGIFETEFNIIIKNGFKKE